MTLEERILNKSIEIIFTSEYPVRFVSFKNTDKLVIANNLKEAVFTSSKEFFFNGAVSQQKYIEIKYITHSNNFLLDIEEDGWRTLCKFYNDFISALDASGLIINDEDIKKIKDLASR